MLLQVTLTRHSGRLSPGLRQLQPLSAPVPHYTMRAACERNPSRKSCSFAPCDEGVGTTLLSPQALPKRNSSAGQDWAPDAVPSGALVTLWWSLAASARLSSSPGALSLTLLAGWRAGGGVRSAAVAGGPACALLGDLTSEIAPSEAQLEHAMSAALDGARHTRAQRRWRAARLAVEFVNTAKRPPPQPN